MTAIIMNKICAFEYVMKPFIPQRIMDVLCNNILSVVTDAHYLLWMCN